MSRQVEIEDGIRDAGSRVYEQDIDIGFKLVEQFEKEQLLFIREPGEFLNTRAGRHDLHPAGAIDKHLIEPLLPAQHVTHVVLWGKAEKDVYISQPEVGVHYEGSQPEAIKGHRQIDHHVAFPDS